MLKHTITFRFSSSFLPLAANKVFQATNKAFKAPSAKNDPETQWRIISLALKTKEKAKPL